MTKKQVVFLGSKPIGYYCFQWILQHRQSLNYEVVGCITKSRGEFGAGFDIASLAIENHIPIYNSLDHLPECDIICSVQYHEILKQTHIDKAKQVAVNLHMAPLPEYRGSNQFSFAIIDNKKFFGTTLHAMDERIDHGAILFQKRFEIPERCWVNQLYDLTVDASKQMFEESWVKIIKKKYKLRAQKKFEKKLGTVLHYKNEAAQLKIISLDWEVDQMDRHIRATSMPGFEPPYCIVKESKAYFIRKKND